MVARSCEFESHPAHDETGSSESVSFLIRNSRILYDNMKTEREKMLAGELYDAKL